MFALQKAYLVLDREYLDNVPLFQGCEEKFLDAVSVLLREVQVDLNSYDVPIHFVIEGNSLSIMMNRSKIPILQCN